MQAGRLTEQVEIYKQSDDLVLNGLTPLRRREPIAKAMASIKVANGGYVDEFGGYAPSQAVVIEMHYHIAGALFVGGLIIRKTHNVRRYVAGEGGGGGEHIEPAGLMLYEIESVEPNRALNRVYVNARLLKVL